MKIAAAGYPIDWHNRWNDYVGKLRVWVRTAAEQGAELLLFPEYAALELASLAEEQNARDLQRSINAVTARIKDVDELHGSLAREFQVHICAATAPLRVEGRTVNRARLFAPDGTHVVQDKLMPGRYETGEWGIAPGGPARVFETAGGRIGVLICEDVTFPLIGRAMVEAGAEILLVPSCTDTLRAYAQIRVGAMARALEGQCVVVHAPTIGDATWMPAVDHNHGTAAVYGPPEAGLPDDGVIAQGKADTAGWVHADVSLDSLRQARAEGARVFRDWDAQAARIGAVEVVSLGSVLA